MTQPYSVIQRFKATEPVSGREHQFEVGDTVLYDIGQTRASITIEFEWSLFLVERSVFEACCHFKNEGPPL
jgi:hypothetical protein